MTAPRAADNPYRPSWGAAPPVLAGRDAQLQESLAALAAGPRHPLFSHVYHGDRGTGKTVLLDAIADRARARRWVTIAVACGTGTSVIETLADLYLPEALKRLSRRRPRSGATTDVHGSLGIPGVAHVSAGATWAAGEHSAGVRFERALTQVGEAAARREVGVLITLDELHAIDTALDLPAFAGVLQLLAQRRGLPISLIGAGLPEVVDVLAGPAVTFLERLRKLELGYLSPDAARYALLAPAQAAGVTLDLDAAEQLAAASDGYPYYVQLLGWEAWSAAARARGSRITLHHARVGARAAATVVIEQILQPRFGRLPPKEQAYLEAMAVDGDAGSRTADLVARLGVKDATEISYLRERLLRKHMIRTVGRGQVRFSLPGMGAWLRVRDRGLPPARP